METITVNGHEIEVSELHESLPLVKFKLTRHWCRISDAFLPNMTALQWLINRGPLWDSAEKKFASNSALRRWLDQGAVRFNGQVVTANKMLDFPVLSVIMFPKSDTQRITLY